MTKRNQQKHRANLYRAFFIASNKALNDIKQIAKNKKMEQTIEHKAYTFITTRQPITYIPKR